MASASRCRFPPKEREALGILPLPTRIWMRRLLWFYELPEWFQLGNNEWVRYGYRPMSNSIRASFRSWWYLHNETVNIYSHLIPAVVFLLGEYHILQCLAGRYPRVTSADLVAFSCFMLTATICFASSALYHTLMNHSYTVDRLCHRFDMAGIGIFITGDIVLGVYIIFWCETTLRDIYWSMVS
jgi:adiponectin receptor